MTPLAIERRFALYQGVAQVGYPGTWEGRSLRARIITSNTHRFNTLEADLAGKVGSAPEVIERLKEDRQKVKDLFEEFQSAEEPARAEIASTAIMELEIHAEVEEKSICPRRSGAG